MRGMDHIETSRLRQLQREVAACTDRARDKFPKDKAIETLPLVYGQNALVEEVGKLSRCLNKLVIAEDTRVIMDWEQEASHRMITCMSLLERMHITLNFPSVVSFMGGKQT